MLAHMIFVKHNVSVYETLEKLNWSPGEFVNRTQEKGSDLNTGTPLQPATQYPFLKSGKRQGHGANKENSAPVCVSKRLASSW